MTYFNEIKRIINSLSKPIFIAIALTKIGIYGANRAIYAYLILGIAYL